MADFLPFEEEKNNKDNFLPFEETGEEIKAGQISSSMPIKSKYTKEDNKYNFLKDTVKALGSGAMRIVGGIDTAPSVFARAAYNLAAVPQNKLAELTGNEKMKVSFEENIADLPGIKQVDEFLLESGKTAQDLSKELSPMQQFDKDMLTNINEGNWKEFGKQIWLSGVENAPQLALMAATAGLGGAGTASNLIGQSALKSSLMTNLPLGIMGASATGQEYTENLKNKDLTENEKLLDAVTKGAAEAAWERVWTLPMINKIANNEAVEREIREGFVNAVVDYGKKALKSAGGESFEEIGTELTNIGTDISFGKDIGNVPSRLATAGLGALLPGAAMGTISNVQSRNYNQELAQARKEAIDKLIKNPNQFEVKEFEPIDKNRLVIPLEQLPEREIAGLLAEPVTEEEVIQLGTDEALGPPVIELLPDSQTYIDTGSGELFVAGGEEIELPKTNKKRGPAGEYIGNEINITPQQEQTGQSNVIDINTLHEDGPLNSLQLDALQRNNINAVNADDIDSLADVKGIGPKTIEKLKSYVNEQQETITQEQPQQPQPETQTEEKPEVLELEESQTNIEGIPKHLQSIIEKDGDKYAVENNDVKYKFAKLQDAIDNAQSIYNKSAAGEEQIAEVETKATEPIKLENMNKRAQIFAKKYGFFDNTVYMPWVAKKVNEFREEKGLSESAKLPDEEFNSYLQEQPLENDIINRIEEIKEIKKDRLKGTKTGQITEETIEEGKTTPMPEKPRNEDIEPPQNEIIKGDRVKWTTEPVKGETTTWEGTVEQIKPAGEGNRYIIRTDEDQQIRGFDYKGKMELIEKNQIETGEETEPEVIEWNEGLENKFYLKAPIQMAKNLSNQELDKLTKYINGRLDTDLDNIDTNQLQNYKNTISKIDKAKRLKEDLDLTTPSGTADIGGYAEDTTPSIMDTPEIVELAKAINEGKYPQIKEKLRGSAIGRFTSNSEKGDIKLQADIFIGPPVESHVVKMDGLKELEENLADKYGEQENIVVKKKYNKNRGAYEVTVYKKDPTYANKVLMHEVGHLIDWLPDKNLSRGNIIGHLASLKESYRKKAYKNIRTNKEIRQELIDLSQKWKSYNPNNEKIRKYRESSKELYADAISVLGNNPQMLQEEAPTFYKNFMEHLDKKPKVKAAYEDIQNRLKFRSELQGEYYLEQMRNMIDKGTQKRLDIKNKTTQEQKTKTKELLDEVVYLMFEKDYKINRYAKEGLKASDTERYNRALKARALLEESRYIAAEIQNYLLDITNAIDAQIAKTEGLNKTDFGVYLIGNRVVNERSMMANPKGMNPESIEKTFNALERDVGPEKMGEYEQLAQKFNQLRQELVIKRLKESRMYRPELIEYMENNAAYAKFEVIDYLEKHYGKNNTGKIFKQVGTLKEIDNAYIATIINDMSLLRSAIMNESKLATTSMMVNDFQNEIEEAETRFVNNHLEAIEPKEDGKGLLTMMLDGEVQSYYVPENVANTFTYNPVEARNISKWFSKKTQFIKDLYVTINPAWLVRNVPRDFQNTIVKNQEIKPRHMIKLARYLKQGMKEAKQLLEEGVKSEDIETMMKNRMLAPTRMYSDVELDVEDELEWLQKEYELLAETHNQRIEDEKRIKKFIKAVNVFNKENPYHQWMNKKGQITELGNKIAGYKFLKEETDLSMEEIGHRVRTRVGTPDYKRQGKAQQLTNSVFLYSNISKEDVRSHGEAFQDNKFSYAWKVMLFNVMPKVLLWGARLFAIENGIEWLQTCIEGMTSYDKRHNTCIPLGVDSEGNSIYAKVPQNHFGAKIGAAFQAAAEGNFIGEGSVAGELMDIMPYNPSNINHMVMGLVDIYRYISSNAIPYDYFRNRLAFPDYLRGGERHKSFAEYEWRKLGMDMFYDPYKNLFSDTTYDKLTSFFPFNIIEPLFRITDYGHEEDNNNNSGSGYGY